MLNPTVGENGILSYVQMTIYCKGEWNHHGSLMKLHCKSVNEILL